MNAAVSVFQAVLLLLLAPLLQGTIARIKARLQNRQGASIFRPYQELLKLFRKEDLVPTTASALLRITPVVVFAATFAASLFLPVLHDAALLGMGGDFVVVVYLLAMSRFFLMLGGMDGGSAFGGMGASREVLVSTLAEAPLLLGLTAVMIVSRTASISGVVHWTLQQDLSQFSAVHALALATLALVAIAETGRIPVDNPTTHLELTMIHEAMILEYSGPSLALIEWASALKLTLISALLIGLFSPWGIAAAGSLFMIALALVALVLKLAIISLVLAIVESGIAKLRMYMVPDFLGVASALALLAIVFAGMGR
jgi:formate hydrogenlyase subunit 4